LNIARVRHIFFPYIPKDYIYELSVNQSKAIHIDLLTCHKKMGAFSEKINENFTVYRLPELNLGLRESIAFNPFTPNLPNFLKVLDPDIIHCESHLFIMSLQAIRKSVELKIPSVVTIHGVKANRDFFINQAQELYIRTIAIPALKKVNRVICLTKSDAAEMVNYGLSQEKIRYIPNAVNHELFKPSSKTPDNLIVWTGRFVSEKNLVGLIKIIRHVVHKDHSVKFLLIGYGPLKSKVIHLVNSAGLSKNNVEIVGPLDRVQIAEKLRSAKIFLFPSFKEGLPVSVLEAMASGLPVVGSRIPGVADIVKENYNGYLYRPVDYEKMGDSILRLLADESLCATFGKNSRKIIIDNYTWPTILESYIQIYNELAN
jgi:glycosyltransferase involved in cell wall biosynthesis